MKPFIGIDLTEDKKNEQWNGEEFLMKKPSEALLASLENSKETVLNNVEKTGLPLILRILLGISGLGAVILVRGIAGALEDVTFAEAYRNAAWIFWACGICAAVFVILLVMQGRKEKKVMGSEEYETDLSHFDGAVKAVEAELGVPSNAKETDILGFYYKRKDGKPKPIEKGMQTCKYVTAVFSAYADAENLYLSNMDGTYAFPRSSLKAIRTVRKKITVSDWNKDEPINSPEYKPYKLSEDGYGQITCRQYHILELERDGETWGIWYPSYENPTFEELTGLKAETDASDDDPLNGGNKS